MKPISLKRVMDSWNFRNSIANTYPELYTILMTEVQHIMNNNMHVLNQLRLWNGPIYGIWLRSRGLKGIIKK